MLSIYCSESRFAVELWQITPGFCAFLKSDDNWSEYLLKLSNNLNLLRKFSHNWAEVTRLQPLILWSLVEACKQKVILPKFCSNACTFLCIHNTIWVTSFSKMIFFLLCALFNATQINFTRLTVAYCYKTVNVGAIYGWFGAPLALFIYCRCVRVSLWEIFANKLFVYDR